MAKKVYDMFVSGIAPKSKKFQNSTMFICLFVVIIFLLVQVLLLVRPAEGLDIKPFSGFKETQKIVENHKVEQINRNEIPETEEKSDNSTVEKEEKEKKEKEEKEKKEKWAEGKVQRKKQLSGKDVALVSYWASQTNKEHFVHFSDNYFHSIVKYGFTSMSTYTSHFKMPFFFRNQHLVDTETKAAYWGKMGVIKYYFKGGYGNFINGVNLTTFRMDNLDRCGCFVCEQKPVNNYKLDSKGA